MESLPIPWLITCYGAWGPSGSEMAILLSLRV
jgi:hypothetical protein